MTDDRWNDDLYIGGLYRGTKKGEITRQALPFSILASFGAPIRVSGAGYFNPALSQNRT